MKKILFLIIINITNTGLAQLNLPIDHSFLVGDSINGLSAKIFWHSDNAAFRSGYIDGNIFDLGFLSSAFGDRTIARGSYSFASGSTSYASGISSSALGQGTVSQAYASTAVGTYNLGNGNTNTWIVSDPVFEVGIGTEVHRKNALTILKNGQTHIPHGQDASLSSHGFLMIGNPLSTNVIIDDNEIMARQNGQIANLHINQDGGNLYLGGNVFLNVTPNGDRANLQLDINTGQIFWENSSLRFKENIQTLEDEWLKILHTRPVKYTRPGAENYWEYGYLAEEIDSIGLTNLVTYDTTGLPNNVNYEKMVLYLTEIIKIQQQDIQEQQNQIRSMDARMEEQQIRLSRLEKSPRYKKTDRGR